MSPITERQLREQLTHEARQACALRGLGWGLVNGGLATVCLIAAETAAPSLFNHFLEGLLALVFGVVVFTQRNVAFNLGVNSQRLAERHIAEIKEQEAAARDDG